MRRSLRPSAKASGPRRFGAAAYGSGSTSWSRARTCAPCASCTTAPATSSPKSLPERRTGRGVRGAREQGGGATLYDAATLALARSRRHFMRVVDRVGGGDRFAAGLIAARLGAQTPAAALDVAVAAGALKLAVPGDFGRATVEDIQRLVHACT